MLVSLGAKRRRILEVRDLEILHFVQEDEEINNLANSVLVLNILVIIVWVFLY